MACGLEAMIHRARELGDGRRELVYICRNRRCERSGQELGSVVVERQAEEKKQ